MKLRCINIGKNDGSLMFHTGGVYTTRNQVNRTHEVTDDLGHTRVLLVNDKGRARFCIGHLPTKGASGYFATEQWAHFNVVEEPILTYGGFNGLLTR